MVRGTGGPPWSDLLDIAQAGKNCYADIFGDWHRDQWGWAELAWVVKAEPQFAYERLASYGARAPALLDVPKENFVLRPAMVLDPIDRLCYQALVDRESIRLVGALSPLSYGWRLPRQGAAAGKYANQSLEWEQYRSRLVELAQRYGCALQTDIVSYFASIDIPILVEKLRIRLRRTALSERLIGMLEAWNTVALRKGLPQRALPSSILANMYLEPLDDLLRSVGVDSVGSTDAPTSVRWVDDIWVFGADASKLRRVQMDLQREAALLHLNLSSGKTGILEGDDLMRTVRESEHSAVDEALGYDEPDEKPLDSLIERIIAKPELASRTSIKFATRRMREKRLFSRVDQLMSVGHRMPHGADALARLVRDSDGWQRQVDWFVWYAKSDWVPSDWAVAQFATMFPSSLTFVEVGVVESLMKALNFRSAISLFAVAAHRLAGWRPGSARSAFRDIGAAATAGWQRRILAMAGLQAGLDAPWARALLGDFEENRVTLAYLTDKGFRVKTATDYA